MTMDSGALGGEQMDKFSKMWADQLRAGALEIADKAEAIVSDIDRNLEMSVTIRLTPGNGTMKIPTIEIHRDFFSKPMFDAFKNSKKEERDD